MPYGIARICNAAPGDARPIECSKTCATSTPFHEKHYEMKLMDFFVKLGADTQSHWQCGKGMQRRMTEKDEISCSGFGETDY